MVSSGTFPLMLTCAVYQHILKAYPNRVPYDVFFDATSFAQNYKQLMVLETVTGISLVLTNDGLVDAMAVSTPKKAIVFDPVPSPDAEPLSKSDINALESISPHLSSFDLAALIVLLKTQWGVSLSGYDISTMQFDVAIKPGANCTLPIRAHTAAECVERTAEFPGDSDPIAAGVLWNSLVQGQDEGYDRLVLRAWLSAVAASAGQVGNAAVRVDLSHLDSKALSILSKTVLAKLLDSKQPLPVGLDVLNGGYKRKMNINTQVDIEDKLTNLQDLSVTFVSNLS